jgi:hypothetical protein
MVFRPTLSSSDNLNTGQTGNASSVERVYQILTSREPTLAENLIELKQVHSRFQAGANGIELHQYLGSKIPKLTHQRHGKHSRHDIVVLVLVRRVQECRRTSGLFDRCSENNIRSYFHSHGVSLLGQPLSKTMVDSISMSGGGLYRSSFRRKEDAKSYDPVVDDKQILRGCNLIRAGWRSCPVYLRTRCQ